MITEELLEFAASGLTGISGMFEAIIFTAFLLTYAENIAFYFYALYLPYKLAKKGINLALKVLFIFLMVTVLIELKWMVSENVFSHPGNDTTLEALIDLSNRVIKHGT